MASQEEPSISVASQEEFKKSPIHIVMENGKWKGGKIKKVYKTPNRKYNPSWEDIPELANWLSRSPFDEHKAWCTICERELRTHMTDLRKHRESAKHQKREYEVENGIDNREVISNFSALFEVLRHM